jgi:hypothetical protein
LTSLVQPAAVVALTNVRLRDAAEALSRKLDATTVNVRIGGTSSGVARSRFGPTERRVLGLLQAASEMLGGADQAPVPVTSPLYPGPSRFAVLGSAGFELASYADMFSEGGDWRASLLRRGTPDPQRSLEVVPTTTFANAAGAVSLNAAKARPQAQRDAARKRAEAFTLGLMAAVAHGVAFGPAQRGERQRATSRAWTRHQPGPMLAAADSAFLSRVVGGDSPATQWRRWWPSATEAAPFWPVLFDALDATYEIDHRDAGAKGWPAFESRLHPGPSLSADRLAAGYERLLSNASPWGMGAWFGVLTPFLLSPSISLLLGLALPHAPRFFSPTDPLTERSFTELFSLAESVSALTPFITSMIMWANIPEHTNAFVNALVLFLARAALFLGWLPTIGDEQDDPHPNVRLLIAGGMLGADLYAAWRAAGARNGRQPGKAVVFGVQTIPGILAVSTLLQGLAIKGVVALTKEAGGSDDAATALGGVTLALTGLGTWLGVGLPLAHSLARGGGWTSWFRTIDGPSLTGTVSAVGGAREPSGLAALFDDSTLWHDPARPGPGRADLRYPTGGRPLVKVWRTGDAELEILPTDNAIRIRGGAAPTDVPIGPGKRSVADVVAALKAVPGVDAAPADTGELYDLPWPSSLSDPGDESDPRVPDGDPSRTTFTRLPTSEDKAYVVRHSPAAELTTSFGLTAPSASRFDAVRLVPGTTLADVEDTGAGAAADLALLLSLGAASRLRDVSPATPDPELVTGAPPLAGPIGHVDRVFRDWNLDDRRVNEWRMIVAGGATPEDAPPAGDDRVQGERVAHALGWVPLWRAWLRVASDTTQDAAAPLAAPYAPTVRTADGEILQPTNAQLSAGIRYLLDLPA